MSRSTKVKGCGLKLVLFLREKPAGASVFSRIFSNMEVRGTLYIFKDIREYGVKANRRGPLQPCGLASPPVGGVEVGGLEDGPLSLREGGAGGVEAWRGVEGWLSLLALSI